MDRMLVGLQNHLKLASMGQLLADEQLGMDCPQEHSMAAQQQVHYRLGYRSGLDLQMDLGQQEQVRRMDHPKVVEHVRR
jgi:hypothetical protein